MIASTHKTQKTWRVLKTRASCIWLTCCCVLGLWGYAWSRYFLHSVRLLKHIFGVDDIVVNLRPEKGNDNDSCYEQVNNFKYRKQYNLQNLITYMLYPFIFINIRFWNELSIYLSIFLWFLSKGFELKMWEKMQTCHFSDEANVI